MMYRGLLLITLMVALVGASSNVFAEKPSEPITVVELFTSQGCYSCPPADEFLGELAERDNVITLACHVTYWNYIGWKDTFSLPFCDNRQRQYQGALIDGNRGVYTPQMIINGRYGGVGSRKHIIDRIIQYDHQQQPALLPVHLEFTSASQEPDKPALLIRIEPADHASKRKQHRQLFLMGTTGKHVLPINKGENAGKRLPYYNPVEHVQNLGSWDGKSWEETVMLPDNSSIKHWVVVAQQWPVGPMVAAGKIAVSPDFMVRY